MTIKGLAVAVMWAGMTSFATASDIPPDELVMPCERHVQVDDITRLVVPMVPFRGVNLIFPFELNNATTTYALSSNLVWDFAKADGTRMVPISFASFAGEWGELTDFTIATGDHIFSITLKADRDIRNHCTNVVFDFSPEQLQAIRDGERQEHLARLDEEYQAKLDALDEEASQKALELVGSLAQGSPSDSGIHEYKTLVLSNGDEVELYVQELQGWGKFSLIKAEITNDSQQSPLYIDRLVVGALDENGRKRPIVGHAEVPPRLDADDEGRVTFTTTSNIPETGGYMELETDRGSVEVTW